MWIVSSKLRVLATAVLRHSHLLITAPSAYGARRGTRRVESISRPRRRERSTTASDLRLRPVAQRGEHAGASKRRTSSPSTSIRERYLKRSARRSSQATGGALSQVDARAAERRPAGALPGAAAAAEAGGARPDAASRRRCSRSTPSTTSSSARATSSRTPRARRSPTSRATTTTRSSSTAASASARRTWSTPSATRSSTATPSARVVYLSSESFMNELITALRRDRMDEFKSRFRRIDVLIVDDVQFLAGRERTQEEFFHTFNSLYDSAPPDRPHLRQVPEGDPRPRGAPAQPLRVGADRRHPAARHGDARRHPREEGGAGGHRPAARRRALPRLQHRLERARARGLADPPRRLRLAQQVPDHGRLRARGAAERPAREAIAAITIESIQKAVCDFFRVRPDDLRSKKRTRTVAVPRQVAMYLCRRYTEASFPVIGDRFGGRDHSTVIHAAQVVERRMQRGSRPSAPRSSASSASWNAAA